MSQKNIRSELNTAYAAFVMAEHEFKASRANYQKAIRQLGKDLRKKHVKNGNWLATTQTKCDLQRSGLGVSIKFNSAQAAVIDMIATSVTDSGWIICSIQSHNNETEIKAY